MESATTATIGKHRNIEIIFCASLIPSPLGGLTPLKHQRDDIRTAPRGRQTRSGYHPGMPQADASPRGTTPGSNLDATVDLLALARQGDHSALDCLFKRYLPDLLRWTSGRLPRWARDLAETQDLVQDTLLQVFRRIDGFEYRGEGAFQAYLRQAVMNRLRNEVRRAARRPAHAGPDHELEAAGTSPVEAVMGLEMVERYERALQQLAEPEREAVIGRIELGLTYSELADRLGKPSPDAARMAVTRALLRLAKGMDH